MGTPCIPRAGPLLLLAAALLLRGTTALECHSCVERGDGGCSPGKMKVISCPSNVSVCMETVAAVKWSHGQFLVGEKGCNMGITGTNDNGVELNGIIAFSKLHQCNSSRCNSRLDIQAMVLQPTGNESARSPNGLECFSCQGKEACSPSNRTVVKCYEGYRGCFDGNVTMKVGNFSLSHPIKSCSQDQDCTKQATGNVVISLVGSCCSGNLCNSDLANKTFFAPNIPRLEVLPSHGTNATATAATAVMVTAAAATAATAASPEPDHEDHEDHEDLTHDNDHVTVQGERRNDLGIKLPQGGKGGGKGGAAGLSASAWLVLLGAALLL